MQSVTPVWSAPDQGEDMVTARSVLAAVAASVILHAAAVAQVTTADIVGRVTDASGAVLPGVTVTVENLATRETRVAPTSATGDYAFTLLPIGRYAVKIELPGFASQTASAVLAAGDRARIDVKLQVGAVSENVTVVAESPLVQTDSSTLSSLVTEKAVQDLPVNGRNFVRLVQLVPGATEGVPNSTIRTTSCSTASTTTSASSARWSSSRRSTPSPR
jgi:hypothetical protein